jgi:hypothetical protein
MKNNTKHVLMITFTPTCMNIEVLRETIVDGFIKKKEV